MNQWNVNLTTIATIRTERFVETVEANSPIDAVLQLDSEGLLERMHTTPLYATEVAPGMWSVIGSGPTWIRVNGRDVIVVLVKAC